MCKDSFQNVFYSGWDHINQRRLHGFGKSTNHCIVLVGNASSAISCEKTYVICRRSAPQNVCTGTQEGTKIDNLSSTSRQLVFYALKVILGKFGTHILSGTWQEQCMNASNDSPQASAIAAIKRGLM
jgi:hypothetical protein